MNYEAKVKYVKLDPLSGKEKTVSETYLLDAETFGDAEVKTFKEMEKITNATIIATIKKSDIADVIGDKDSSRFFKATVKQTVIDELTGKESSQNMAILCGCNNLKAAVLDIEEYAEKSIFDNEITKIGVSGIIGIFETEA